WQFEKFPGSEPVLGTQMKSVGEVMAIGRTFKQALGKGIRSLETGKSSSAEVFEEDLIVHRLVTPNPDRLGYIGFAFEKGYTVDQIHEFTAIDPWFLRQVKEVIDLEQSASQLTLEAADKKFFVKAKRDGISDSLLARKWNQAPLEVRKRRKE